MRSATRRGKPARFRRQRVLVDLPSEEPAQEDGEDEEANSEKIEVHVHVHRGERTKRSRSKRAVPALTGALFDWQWYRERLCKKPGTTASRWWLTTTCQGCDSPVSPRAHRCPRCGAPRSRRRFLGTVIALIGLGSIAAVLGLCAHVLGDSVPEHRAPAPVGQWSDTEYVIVEVPAAAPSPFSAGASSPANGAAGPGDGLATR